MLRAHPKVKTFVKISTSILLWRKPDEAHDDLCTWRDENRALAYYADYPWDVSKLIELSHTLVLKTKSVGTSVGV